MVVLIPVDEGVAEVDVEVDVEVVFDVEDEVLVVERETVETVDFEVEESVETEDDVWEVEVEGEGRHCEYQGLE